FPGSSQIMRLFSDVCVDDVGGEVMGDCCGMLFRPHQVMGEVASRAADRGAQGADLVTCHVIAGDTEGVVPGVPVHQRSSENCSSMRAMVLSIAQSSHSSGMASASTICANSFIVRAVLRRVPDSMMGATAETSSLAKSSLVIISYRECASYSPTSRMVVMVSWSSATASP